MMGRLPAGQNELFYEFCLEEQVPQKHVLRGLDRFLDFTEIRKHLRAYYSDIGRPSIDPELMIRMLLIGYCYGIRSERRLCEEVHLNLAYRWFCRLGLEDQVPEHSTFSKNRHGRYRESDLFRFVFESVVERCMDEGLVKGEGFAVDASLIKADAHRKRGFPGEEGIEWERAGRKTRAVREYLDALDNDEQAVKASSTECGKCALKDQCCPKEAARKIARSIHEDARDLARALATTEAYAQSRKDRKKVEMLFAHLKRIMRFDRLRLRGPCGAQDEFLLAATVENLRKLAKLLPAPSPEIPIVT